MKKRVSFNVVTLLIFSAVLMTACSPAASATNGQSANTDTTDEQNVEEITAEPVTITYTTFSANAGHEDDLATLVTEFEATHPNIHVETQIIAFDDYFNKLQTMIAGDITPDTYELNYENFVSYAEKGLLIDTSSLATNDSTYNVNIFYPKALEAFQLNDKQLALPETFSTAVLFYNKDLFDAAGLAYPTPDWTWNDVLVAAQALNDPENGVYGFYSPIQFWEFYKKAAQNNCSFFNEEKTETLINSPKCVEALQTMSDFVNKYHVMPSEADLGGSSNSDLFLAGKIAMDVTGIWMFSSFADAPFEWDIQVEPGMATHATHFFANGVGISSTSEHPEESWEWIKFITSSSEVATLRVEKGWELPALNDSSYFTEYLEQTPPANRQAVFDSLNFAIVPPVISRQSEMQDIIGNLLTQVDLGTLSSQDALDQAKVQIDELLK